MSTNRLFVCTYKRPGVTFNFLAFVLHRQFVPVSTNRLFVGTYKRPGVTFNFLAFVLHRQLIPPLS